MHRVSKTGCYMVSCKAFPVYCSLCSLWRRIHVSQNIFFHHRLRGHSECAFLSDGYIFVYGKPVSGRCQHQQDLINGVCWFTDLTALVGNGNALVPVFIALVMTQHSYNHLPENLKNHYFIARHGFSLANNAKLICSNPEIAIPEIGGPLNTGWGLHERGKEQVKKVQLC